MEKFMKGVRKMPIHWQVWVMLLVLINGVLPLFFLGEPVAVVTLSAMIAGAAIGLILVEEQGFTKLLGLMHAPWIPMWVMQIHVLLTLEHSGSFSQWLKASVAVTTISLAIDIVDVMSYLKGNRRDLLRT